MRCPEERSPATAEPYRLPAVPAEPLRGDLLMMSNSVRPSTGRQVTQGLSCDSREDALVDGPAHAAHLDQGVVDIPEDEPTGSASSTPRQARPPVSQAKIPHHRCSEDSPRRLLGCAMDDQLAHAVGDRVRLHRLSGRRSHVVVARARWDHHGLPVSDRAWKGPHHGANAEIAEPCTGTGEALPGRYPGPATAARTAAGSTVRSWLMQSTPSVHVDAGVAQTMVWFQSPSAAKPQ
jgi:hypothetical protein